MPSPRPTVRASRRVGVEHVVEAQSPDRFDAARGVRPARTRDRIISAITMSTIAPTGGTFPPTRGRPAWWPAGSAASLVTRHARNARAQIPRRQPPADRPAAVAVVRRLRELHRAQARPQRDRIPRGALLRQLRRPSPDPRSAQSSRWPAEAAMSASSRTGAPAP